MRKVLTIIIGIAIAFFIGLIVGSYYAVFPSKTNYDNFVDLWKFIQSFVTTMVALWGAWLGTRLLHQKRELRFRADINQEVSHLKTPDGNIVLQVSVSIANKGLVLLTLPKWEFEIRRVIPIPDSSLMRINTEKMLDENLVWPYIDRVRFVYSNRTFA
jgi:hypothetical protein